MELAVGVLSNLVDHAVQRTANPPDRTELLRIVGTPINDVLSFKQRLYLLETDAALGISPKPPAFLRIEVKPHVYLLYQLGYIPRDGECVRTWEL